MKGVQQAQEKRDPPTLKWGDRGEAVRELQRCLCSIGYRDMDGLMRTDGDFGDRTRRAVEAFQYDYGLVADGIVGPRTWRALRHALRRCSSARPSVD